MREKKDINIEIGGNIQVAREQAGYTQDTLSEMLGMTPNHLSAIERGASGISLEALQRLCRLLGVSADRIIFGTARFGRGNRHKCGKSCRRSPRFSGAAPREAPLPGLRGAYGPRVRLPDADDQGRPAGQNDLPAPAQAPLSLRVRQALLREEHLSRPLSARHQTGHRRHHRRFRETGFRNRDRQPVQRVRRDGHALFQVRGPQSDGAAGGAFSGRVQGKLRREQVQQHRRRPVKPQDHRHSSQSKRERSYPVFLTI